MIDFLGLGAQKAGTSWVYACLYEHPGICAPIKELHFFSRLRYEKGREWYESHFKNCKNGLKQGEFSTSYLSSKEAPERIRAFYPDVKLIAILRNPVDRAYSEYRNAIKAGEVDTDVSFDEYTRQKKSVLKQGLYAVQLKRYLRYFDRDQLLVLIYEDSRKDPAAFIRRVYQFLGVDPDFVPSMLHKEVNVARTPKLVVIERIMHSIAESLRRLGFDKLVWKVRRSGLTDFIRRLNTARDEVRTGVPTEGIAHAFNSDILELSALLGRDMDKEWNSNYDSKTQNT